MLNHCRDHLMTMQWPASSGLKRLTAADCCSGTVRKVPCKYPYDLQGAAAVLMTLDGSASPSTVAHVRTTAIVCLCCPLWQGTNRR